MNGRKVARITLSPSLRAVTAHVHGRGGWRRNDRASFFSPAIAVIGSIAAAAATFPSLISLSICDLEAPAVCNKSLEKQEDQGHSESFRLDPEVLKAAVKEFTEIVGESNVSVDSQDLEAHGTPRYSYHRSSSMPDVVVMPCTTEEVSRVMKVCSKYRLPVVPYGGATSIEGHLLSLNGGVSVDMINMNALLRLNKADHDVTAQAGLGYLELNEHLAKEGLWFPLDPGPGAKVSLSHEENAAENCLLKITFIFLRCSVTEPINQTGIDWLTNGIGLLLFFAQYSNHNFCSRLGGCVHADAQAQLL